MGKTIPSTQTQTVKGIQLRLKRIKALLQINQSIKKKKMGEENGYSWFCWRRSPAYVAAPKEQPELNASPLQRDFPSPLQRASGTVLVELVELPIGPVSISNPDTNNNDNINNNNHNNNNNNNNNPNCSELSTKPTSILASYNSLNSTTVHTDRISTMSGSSSITSISSISSSSLPPYSELVKELGTL